MSNDGYVHLHRKLMNNPVYGNSTALHCWIHCLLKASFTNREFYWKRKKIKLLPGQFITGRDKFGSEINVSPSTAWYWLERFEVDSMIDIHRTPKGSVVTIKGWKEYQKVDSNVNNEKTTNEQQKNTYNKDNKEKKEKKRERKPPKKKKQFSTLSSLTDEVVKDIAVYYKVPVSFVRDKREALVLHCESKGATYDNYKATLMNFVRRDKEKINEEVTYL